MADPAYEDLRAALAKAEAELRQRGEREDALLSDAYDCERQARKALDVAQKRIEVLEQERDAALQRERAARADRGGNWRKLHTENIRLYWVARDVAEALDGASVDAEAAAKSESDPRMALERIAQNANAAFAGALVALPDAPGPRPASDSTTLRNPSPASPEGKR